MTDAQNQSKTNVKSYWAEAALVHAKLTLKPEAIASGMILNNMTTPDIHDPMGRREVFENEVNRGFMGYQ